MTRSKIEAANLKKYETPIIAKQLGEPMRASYNSHKGKVKMNNSTHYRTVNFNWNDFKYYTVNHNKYPINGISIGPTIP